MAKKIEGEKRGPKPKGIVYAHIKTRVIKGEPLAKLTKARGSIPAATFVQNLIKAATNHIEVSRAEIEQAKKD